MKRSSDELLQAYVDANHELVNALATIKQLTQNALETDGWRHAGQSKGVLEHILDVATGKLTQARVLVR
jgi:hypothetical protein